MTEALDDAALVARCRRGDEAAWTDLVDRFGPYVYTILVRGYRLGAVDVEDAFQEVFVRLYAQLDRLRDDSAVRPWIGQVTRRLALDRLQAEAREPVAAAEDDAWVDPVDRLSRIELSIDVRDAMRGLSDICQEILQRFFIRDESYVTIGGALGIPSGTIASRISRCLDRLRDAMTA